MRIVRAVAASLVLAVAGCDSEPSGPPVAQAGTGADPVAAFLEGHWASLPQARASASEPHRLPLNDLRPSSCAACHKAQYDDWRTSLHSRAMGPGVAGQLKSMDDGERHECQRCHAPLREQMETASPLHASGLVCAGCHIREGHVFGPPRRDGSALASSPQMPHGGWKASGAFEDSRFCATCHQFDSAGLALNGKLLENTFEEWKGSRYAKESRACQSCHMPDRRHIWRGIHDPRMTRAGVAIEALAPRLAPGLRLDGGWRLTNSGTGHFFPTYVTPRVVATIRQETAGGKAIASTAIEHVIARDVAADLSRELSDTRLAPGETRGLLYDKTRHPAATHLAIEIRVEPDAFYTELYRSLLRNATAPTGLGEIRAALEQSIASRYTLYTDRQAIPSRAARAAPRGG